MTTALPLTVRKLMQMVPVMDVRHHLFLDHSIDNPAAHDAYADVQGEIAAMEPKKLIAKDYALTHIQVSLEEFMENDGTDATYLAHNVLGVGPDDTGEVTTWAIEYTPWEVWVGLRIQYVPPMSHAEVAAAILREMTWNGFSAEAVRDKIAAFDRMIDEAGPEDFAPISPE